MTHSKRSCSGIDWGKAGRDAEFRSIMDTLFCSCRDGSQQKDNRLRRDLFYLTEIEGRTLADAARALGLGVGDADRMLAGTRRDVAVLRVLGLIRPSGTARAGSARSAVMMPACGTDFLPSPKNL